MSDISAQLAEQVSAARRQGKKLAIVGRGSKSTLGRQTSGEPISVAEHSGIVSYRPVELVITARAGTTVAEINAALDEHDQMLSCEPPDFGGRASIGGTLACNQSGPGRPWGGSIRDAVLGVRLINGLAEQLRFGGQVMKNVAGYDVSRLQAGSMGTLGLLTEISFKVLPKPAASLTLVQAMGVDEAIVTMNQLAATAKPLSGACWLDHKLYLRLAGAASAVEGTVAKWSGEVLENAAQFWQELREQQLDFFAGAAPLWRFSVKSTAGHCYPEANWLIDWGGAQRWMRVEDDQAYSREHMEEAARVAGGQLSLYRGGDRSGEVFHTQPRALQELHKRVKAALDPDGLYNPGRLYSWL